jgi:alanine racemase
MGRIGFRDTGDLRAVLDEAHKLGNIDIDGIFTHFSCADEEDQAFSAEQLARFRGFIAAARDAGYELKAHALNSAGGLCGAEGLLDYVRCGISIYGYYPSNYTKKAA